MKRRDAHLCVLGAWVGGWDLGVMYYAKGSRPRHQQARAKQQCRWGTVRCNMSANRATAGRACVQVVGMM